LKNFESSSHIAVYFDKKASSKELHEIRAKIKKRQRKALVKKAIFGFFFLAISIYFIGFYKY
jgi:cell division protein FtsX